MTQDPQSQTNENRICAIIGAGIIGRSWACVFLRAGWSVQLWDVFDSISNGAPTLIKDALENTLPSDIAVEHLTRLTVASSLEESVMGASFIQESGPENINVKAELFAQLDAAAPNSTIIASSSTAIVVSKFTAALKGRGRCIIGHPMNPPHLAPIVEICGAEWTSAHVIERAKTIYSDVGQSPIVVRSEINGFILNRLQAVLLSEAFRLVGEGYVSAADLDKTVCDGLGLRWSFMGPFETIQLNAPGGIPDYCARFGPAMLAAASAPVTPDIWSKDNVARIQASMGDNLDQDDIAQKSQWRDARLSALQDHKKSHSPYKT